MERTTLYGVFAALLLWGLLLSASATFYAYDPIVLNNSLITNLAEPTNNYQAATKNYTDSTTTLTCTNYSVSNSYCRSGTGACYASKFTADKVCYDKSADRSPYAASYEYNYTGATSAYRYDGGTTWTSVTSDQEDVGYGGSGRDSTSGKSNTSFITEVLCCG